MSSRGTRCADWDECLTLGSQQMRMLLRENKEEYPSSKDEVSLKGLAAEAVHERRTWQD